MFNSIYFVVIFATQIIDSFKENRIMNMDGKKNKIAVIIPAYNAEHTISKTLDSLLNQTLKEIEIWVVDDGSIDNTYDVINAYSNKYPRIHTVKKENGGGYSARNAAINKINAEYIGFVDADDTIEPTMYEELYLFASKYTLDAARCDTDASPDIGKETELFLNKEEVFNNVFLPLLIQGIGAATVWDHIYKVPSEGFVLHNSNIMMSEDMMINLQFLRNVTRYGHLHKGLYRYLVNDGSSVRNFRSKNVQDFQEIINYREQVLPKWYNVSADSIDEAKWVIKNAFNNLISASTAKTNSFSERIANVKTLLDIKQVKASVDRLWEAKQINVPVRLLKLCYCGFSIPIVLAIYIKRRIL